MPGVNLDPQQIMQLAGLLAALVLVSFSLKGRLGDAFGFRKWAADRKARRHAEQAAQRPVNQEPDEKRGPWG